MVWRGVQLSLILWRDVIFHFALNFVTADRHVTSWWFDLDSVCPLVMNCRCSSSIAQRGSKFAWTFPARHFILSFQVCFAQWTWVLLFVDFIILKSGILERYEQHEQGGWWRVSAKVLLGTVYMSWYFELDVTMRVHVRNSTSLN